MSGSARIAAIYILGLNGKDWREIPIVAVLCANGINGSKAKRRAIKNVTGLCTPGHGSSQGERRLSSFSGVQTLLEPFQNFVENPPHSVWAKRYPFRELPGLFQSRNVCRTIRNHLLQLTLGNYLHRNISLLKEHRDAQVQPTPRWR